jgi:hypothetical protein
MTDKRDFKPQKVQCSEYGDIFQSKYSGHFASCLYKKSFIDQNEYYTRYGGYTILYMESNTENKDIEQTEI